MSLCYCKDAQTKYHPGGPYYYGGFANYKIPFQPIEELTLAEAKLRESYYEAVRPHIVLPNILPNISPFVV
jgi:hypothetical protein